MITKNSAYLTKVGNSDLVYGDILPAIVVLKFISG